VPSLPSGSGLDRRPPSEEADDRARDRDRRTLLDLLRDTVLRVDDGVARFFVLLAGASSSSSSSGSDLPPAERASSSRLALLVRYAGRGRGGCWETRGSGSWCVVVASSSRLALLVRYGRGGCCWGTTGSWCVGASSPDCSPDSSSLVATSLGLPTALPRDLDGAPPIISSVSIPGYHWRIMGDRPLGLDMILTRRLSYARWGSQVEDVEDTLTLA
jgi:hypothetical protein